MKFDRVRNEEQRKYRLQQIKDAAINLFDNTKYHEITLTMIAKQASFTRGNLYKYITSKEDIYLLILLDELKELNIHLTKEVIEDMTNQTNKFITLWTSILFEHPRFLELLTLMLTLLEQNVTLEKLIEFKNQWYDETIKTYKVIQLAFPTWKDETCRLFMEYQKNYSIGLYPTTKPSDIQQEATNHSKMVYEFPDFRENLSKFLRVIIKALP